MEKRRTGEGAIEAPDRDGERYGSQNPHRGNLHVATPATSNKSSTGNLAFHASYVPGSTTLLSASAVIVGVDSERARRPVVLHVDLRDRLQARRAAALHCVGWRQEGQLRRLCRSQSNRPPYQQQNSARLSLQLQRKATTRPSPPLVPDLGDQTCEETADPAEVPAPRRSGSKETETAQRLTETTKGNRQTGRLPDIMERSVERCSVARSVLISISSTHVGYGYPDRIARLLFELEDTASNEVEMSPESQRSNEKQSSIPENSGVPTALEGAGDGESRE
ncbi:hypothetical protein K490DRAFT_53360 [Saccharata proteae CBS 121410]|uniref:Uncharacterized protein n=1 Tax=Saccharata proteae CBS 121410 TaxID=1314787 RepID=A0A9P4LZ31_9PEZI|nr:hypothetical protein K490DRAFT_53360 [Saccharata proteae CBS 121410]